MIVRFKVFAWGSNFKWWAQKIVVWPFPCLPNEGNYVNIPDGGGEHLMGDRRSHSVTFLPDEKLVEMTFDGITDRQLASLIKHGWEIGGDKE